jgi:hypothetical protein
VRRDFKVSMRRAWELGGAYFPTPGVTPEIVYPYVVEVEAHEAFASALHFLPLGALRDARAGFQDAHLLIASNRLLHALMPNASQSG